MRADELEGGRFEKDDSGDTLGERLLHELEDDTREDRDATVAFSRLGGLDSGGLG
jgi:hypothetical protein